MSVDITMEVVDMKEALILTLVYANMVYIMKSGLIVKSCKFWSTNLRWPPDPVHLK